MAEASKLVPMDHEADPERCQSVILTGQCIYKAVPGGTNCQRHGGNKQVELAEKKKVHDYQLNKWKLRMDEFAESERITSLRGEIGIMRMQLEEILNSCNSTQDLILYSNRIGMVVSQIERLVCSLDKMEARNGNLLGRGAVLTLAGQVVEIIAQEISDPAAVDRVQTQLIDLVAKLAGKETDDNAK